jgi:hypothetical protein
MMRRHGHWAIVLVSARGGIPARGELELGGTMSQATVPRIQRVQGRNVAWSTPS